MYGESNPPPLIRSNIFLNPAHDDAINPTRCSAVIIGNVLSGGDDHGIVLRDKCSPIVMYNFISDFASAGISVQNQCDAMIVNNTIVNCGRGIRLFDHDTRWNAPYCLFPGSGRATVVNTIIWDCPESFTLTDSPYTQNRGSHVTVLYSNVEGGRASASVSANSTLVWGEGNRAEDPRFETGFRLPPGSPLIDAGTNVASVAAFARALEGNGSGSPMPDIGAHEFLLATADSNDDGIPDGWMDRYGLDPLDTAAGALDLDSDGHTTAQEWTADTNPAMAASVLRLESGDAGLEFLASSNRFYTIEFSTNLLSQSWNFLPEFSIRQGTGGRVSVPVPSTNRAGFYPVQARL